MIEKQEAEELARQALEKWGVDADAVIVRRLQHGWRIEALVRADHVIGHSHAGVADSGFVVRIPSGVPDEVADELLLDCGRSAPT